MMTTTPKPAGKNGGKRPGAGRPKTTGSVYEALARTRERHERAKAFRAEIENRVRAGELLEKHDVERASILLHATMANFLRGLPDDLERKANLPPAAVLALESACDSAGLELAGRIKAALGGSE